MKYKQYLTESITNFMEIVDIIKKDCKPFLKEIKGADDFLIRGIKNNGKDFKRYTVKGDRPPRDTPKELHDFYNKMFKKYHGWNVRSEGVFTWNLWRKNNWTGQFHSYMMFPIGQYSYIYSREVDDLYNYVDDLLLKQEGFTPASSDILKHIDDRIMDKLENLIKSKYKTTGIRSIMGKMPLSEVVIKCKSYYMVDTKYYEHLREELNI